MSRITLPVVVVAAVAAAACERDVPLYSLHWPKPRVGDRYTMNGSTTSDLIGPDGSHHHGEDSMKLSVEVRAVNGASFEVGEHYRPTPAQAAVLRDADVRPGSLEFVVKRRDAESIQFGVTFEMPAAGIVPMLRVSGTRTFRAMGDEETYDGTYLTGDTVVGTTHIERRQQAYRATR